MNNIRFHVQPVPWARGCEVYIQHDGAWVQNMECIQVSERMMPPAAMRLLDEQAQELIDKLWMAGYRPTEGKGSAGVLAATERHLADMRRLVFETPLSE